MIFIYLYKGKQNCPSTSFQGWDGALTISFELVIITFEDEIEH